MFNKESEKFAIGVDKFYADKEEKRSYTRDKRVKKPMDSCDGCGTAISSAMAKRNQGYCNPCIDSNQ